MDRMCRFTRLAGFLTHTFKPARATSGYTLEDGGQGGKRESHECSRTHKHVLMQLVFYKKIFFSVFGGKQQLGIDYITIFLKN